MTRIFKLNQIQQALGKIEKMDLMGAIEEGFVLYSQGRVVVPPVGELIFEQPPGDVHIKYGYIRGNDYYVIKVASGFYDNPRINLPAGNGLMLLFEQSTGALVSILLDEGYLTDVRTAVAGAIVAKYLAPKPVRRIGILGTGTQARMQVEYAGPVVGCQEVMVWGRSAENRAAYQEDMSRLGYQVETTLNVNDVASSCDLIVTCTASTSPLLYAEQIRPGTHITAVGSDTPTKQELEARILQRADIVVADSLSQCPERGEMHHAIEGGWIGKERVVELGDVIAKRELRRTRREEITVADLTGVAVQDIQIAKAVYKALVGGLPS